MHTPTHAYEQLLLDAYTSLAWERTDCLCYRAALDRILFFVSIEKGQPTVRVQDQREHMAYCFRGRAANRVMKYLRHNLGA
jgi:hypothetical protein